MRTMFTFVSALAVFGLPAPDRPTHAIERVVVNDNRTPAGVLRNGVLTLRLDAARVSGTPMATPRPASWCARSPSRESRCAFRDR